MDFSLLFIILAIIVIILDAIVAAEFRKVAIEKGYDSSKFFWYPFLFSVAGCLLVVALPDKKGRSAEVTMKTAEEELPEL